MDPHSSRYVWEGCLDVHLEDTRDVVFFPSGVRSVKHDGRSIDGRPCLSATNLAVA